ncbi:MAG: flavodoxin family protein [Candidatus Hermodarchaeota archaeon]
MVPNYKFSVLGIVGSPRKRGNTDILVDEVLSGAKEAGAYTEKVLLNSLNIKPCQACNSCYKTGNCIQNDDMSMLLEKMENSDIWVLGTPIYWWGPTAQFKAFLDRWYHPKHQGFKKKQVILVIPLGGGHERYARHTIGMFEDILNYLSIVLYEKIIAPGFNKRGEILNNPNILKKAYESGFNVIKNYRMA